MKNVCIVGYGSVGPVHAAAIHETAGVNLYAVCDIDQMKAAICCKEYGCKAYSDFDEMLLDTKIDAVHICTPHHLHKDMAVKALAAGKAVVLEKPVGIDMEQLEELRAFHKSSVYPPLCIMLQNRTNACVKAMKQILEERELGKLQGIIANLNWHRDKAYYDQDPWRGKWGTEGGGLLINQAVHLIDLMLYFGGAVEFFESDIHRWGIIGIEVEDTANAVIWFKNGARGIFNATNCYVTDDAFYLDLRFEKGHFRYADGLLYEILDDDVRILARDKKLKIGKSYWGCGHQSVIEEFYTELSEKKGNNQRQYPGIEDAYEAMRLVFGIYSKRKM